MAQRIVTLCDAHQANDEEAPGVEWEVTLRGPGIAKGTTWAVDLCEQDGKTLRDLAVMLDAIGRRTAGKAPTAATAARAAGTSGTARTAPKLRAGATKVPFNDDGSVTCPLCGKRPNGRVAVASHLRHDHEGMSLAAAFGQPEPYSCPECDRAFVNPQGVAAHRRAAHGVHGGGSGGESSGG